MRYWLGTRTRASRGRMVILEKQIMRYPTDRTDKKRAMVRPFRPAPTRRKPAADLREAAERFALPGADERRLADTAEVFFADAGNVLVVPTVSRRPLFLTIGNVAPMLDREREGRAQNPTAAVVDSQSARPRPL